MRGTERAKTPGSLRDTKLYITCYVTCNVFVTICVGGGSRIWTRILNLPAPRTSYCAIFQQENLMWSFILSRDGKDACIGMNRSLEGHGLTSLKRTYWTKQQKQKQQAILLNAGIERRGIQLSYHVVNAAFVVWRRGTGKRVQGLMPLFMYVCTPMVFTSLWCGGSHLWSDTREDALQRLGGEYNARDQDECSIHSGEAFILI